MYARRASYSHLVPGTRLRPISSALHSRPLDFPSYQSSSFSSPIRYNVSVASWCTVTVVDPDGRRHSLDVLADSSYDAAHIFLTHSKTHRGSGLPIPTPETIFEVTAKGRVYKVIGARLRQWIATERTRRNGPSGYLFSKRPTMD